MRDRWRPALLSFVPGRRNSVRTRRLLLAAIIIACILAGLANSFLPHSCPIDLKLLSVEPAGVLNDSGIDLCWVTLSVSNRCGLPLVFVKGTAKGQVKLANRWIDADNVSFPYRLRPTIPEKATVLLPQNSEACRLDLTFSYEHETLKYALGIGLMEPPSLAAARCQSIVRAISPPLFNYIWRTSASPRTHWLSRRFRSITPQVNIPPMVDR
jgi:hypothetical protein